MLNKYSIRNFLFNTYSITKAWAIKITNLSFIKTYSGTDVSEIAASAL